MKYTLFIGLNDKDTKKQEIQTDAAQRLVMVYLANHFDGATVSTAQGVYKHESGELVTEETIRVELFTEDQEAVMNAARAFKAGLNQESIGLTVEPVALDFI